MATNGIAKVLNGEELEPRIKLPDIKPKTRISTFRREDYLGLQETFPIELVSVAVGMSNTFLRKVGRAEGTTHGG